MCKERNLPYNEMADEEVVSLSQQGNMYAMEAILNRYKGFVASKARPYFLIGGNHEDMIQEGMIGLYKAVRDYLPDKQASFRSFAEICITRQMITAIKTATRQKHQPLNSYVSLSRPAYDENSDQTLADVVLGSSCMNPEELIINKESYDACEAAISKALSKLEHKILGLYLQGKSYQEISEQIDKSPKSIDNALQRVKRKLERILSKN
ncbi:MAG: RNA polymerase sporulation sigma factor SigH [Ruminococcaceae bacterium]|nr:RNA polymerase sporulation sigma factor SigH [Oscillospiraceae bacterium]